jgi:cell wall-associated NlpC family hydrolase
VSATTDSPRPLGRRSGLARYSLGAGLITLALVAIVAILATRGSSHHSQNAASQNAASRNLLSQTGGRAQQPPSPAGQAASRAPAASSIPHRTAAGSRAHGDAARASSAEVRDPEEARSFPVSGSVNHQAAATPATAAQEEFRPSPGAASNAQVKHELLNEQKAQAEEHTSAAASGTAATPVPGGESIGGNGALPIPSGVPEVVQKVVAGANAIADFPYVYGGGHASFVDNAYDCSGSVSYALAAGGLLGAPETSGELESWGVAGPGRYITVYANAGHTYMYVDGVLYDTAGRSGTYASRWQVGAVDNSGYVVRHWPGL